MNPAVVLSVCAAAINLGAAVLQAGLSQAPGWRSARTFAIIALTAGLYSVVNLAFCINGVPEAVVLAAGRVEYLLVTAHCVAWLMYAFGGSTASFRQMPRPVRGLAVAALGVGLVLGITGLHLHDAIDTVRVPWAGVWYHYPLATPLGSVYGLTLTGMLGVPFVVFLRRAARGEPHARLQATGFGAFFSCSVVEVLVANRSVEFLSMADVGMLSIVLPVSVATWRRFVADAGRLEELSGRLAGEVRERTEERNRARSALVEAERMAALGRLAAGVGHEINNPLMYLQLSLDEIAQHLGPEEGPAQVALADAKDGSVRIQRVVEGLRIYSTQPREFAALDPREVIPTATAAARADTAKAALDRRLLLVDDEPLILNLLSRALSRRWTVATAADAQTGLDLIDSGRFDAMVCDLMMPGMSGVEMAEAVALRDPALRARTVFLTGGAVTPSAEGFLARPDVRSLTKPVNLAELDRMLGSIVAGAAGGGATPGTTSASPPA